MFELGKNMPSIVDKYSINNEKYDRRVKLTKADKEEIYEAYKQGLFSQRELASLFDVSRRTIQFVISPEKLAENRQRRKEKGGWKQYYDKNRNTIEVREHRKYKKLLLDSGVELKKIA